MDPRFKFLHAKLRRKSDPDDNEDEKVLKDKSSNKGRKKSKKAKKSKKQTNPRGRSPAKTSKSSGSRRTPKQDSVSKGRKAQTRTFLDIETSGPILKESFALVDELSYTNRLSGKISESGSARSLAAEVEPEVNPDQPNVVQRTSTLGKSRRSRPKSNGSLVVRPDVLQVESSTQHHPSEDALLDTNRHRRFPSRPRASAVDDAMRAADALEEERILREARGLKVQEHLRAANRAFAAALKQNQQESKPHHHRTAQEGESKLISWADNVDPVQVHAMVAASEPVVSVESMKRNSDQHNAEGKGLNRASNTSTIISTDVSATTNEPGWERDTHQSNQEVGTDCPKRRSHDGLANVQLGEEQKLQLSRKSSKSSNQSGKSSRKPKKERSRSTESREKQSDRASHEESSIGSSTGNRRPIMRLRSRSEHTSKGTVQSDDALILPKATIRAARRSSDAPRASIRMVESPVTLAAQTIEDEQELFPISLPFSVSKPLEVGPPALTRAVTEPAGNTSEGVLDEQRAFDIVSGAHKIVEEESEPTLIVKKSRGSLTTEVSQLVEDNAGSSVVDESSNDGVAPVLPRKPREVHTRNRLNSVVKKQLQHLLELRQRHAESRRESTLPGPLRPDRPSETKSTKPDDSSTGAENGAETTDTSSGRTKKKSVTSSSTTSDNNRTIRQQSTESLVSADVSATSDSATTSDQVDDSKSRLTTARSESEAVVGNRRTTLGSKNSSQVLESLSARNLRTSSQRKAESERVYKPHPPASPKPKSKPSVSVSGAEQREKEKKARRGSLNKAFLNRTPRFISKFLSNHRSMKQNQHTMEMYEKLHQNAMMEVSESFNSEDYDSFEGDEDNRTVSTHGGGGASLDASARLSHRLSQRALKRLSRRSFRETPNPVHHLPRGGVLVQTSIGSVQFGQPPETVKDSMELGLSVPTIYIIPRERFNLETGVSVSEIEFPAFFNYFVLQKCVTFLTYKETHHDLLTIMKEALDGPDEEHLYSKQEYSKFCPQEIKDSGPDHVKEIAYFRQPGGKESTRIEVSKLIKFVFFDEHGKGDLGNGVTVYDNEMRSQFVLTDGDNEPVNVLYQEAESCAAPLSTRGVSSLARSFHANRFANRIHRKQSSVDTERSTGSDGVPNAESLTRAGPADCVPNSSFVIPTFGLTVLGNSHGFDPEGSTSGFVVWVNGQGVMVDPPPHSSQLLLEAGIEPQSITATILTHCHADHDAGTFQKMITEHKITLMTTATVFESFKRKYAAVSGLHKEFIQQLVHFRPMFLEEPNYWNGAAFRFFYSLHSIPCVGFEVSYEGKKIVYSGDTFYDPVKLEEMYQKGVFSKGRYERLLNFPWHADVVLHEAGVPPIHTPVEALAKLPEDSKKNIYLIHIDGRAARKASGFGFRIASPGVENSITLIKQKREQRILNFLQLVSSMEIFRHFEVSKALELMLMCTEVRYSAGEHVAERGSPGGKFIILLKGSASVTLDGVKKVFRPGDYLGEVSSTTGTTRSATIVAETEVTTMEMDQYALNYLMMNDPHLKMRLEHVVRARSDGSWQAIAHNTRLSLLTTAQKQQLQALLSVRICHRGDVLWRRESTVQEAVLIKDGHFFFEEVHGTISQVPDPKELEADEEEEGDEFGDRSHALLSTGMLLFDLLGVLDGRPLTTTLVCASETAHVFVLEKESMMSFLDRTPMVALALLKSPILI